MDRRAGEAGRACGGSAPASTGTARSAPSRGASWRRRDRRCCSRTSRATRRRAAPSCSSSGLGHRARLALALGLPADTPNAELVQYVMKKNREAVAPRVVVDTGSGQGGGRSAAARSIRRSSPCRSWHHLEGGRYIHTFSGDRHARPDTRVMNVGMYRGMIGKKDTTPFLLIKGGQHWGAALPEVRRARQPMPVACVIGWDPIMGLLAGSPVPAGVCEWDVMGAYRGEPAELVRCETVDLEVPASAEIVIEGLHQRRPGDVRARGPVRRVHRLRVGHSRPAADDADHLHHAPARSDLPRLSRGHAARLATARTA